MLKFNIDKSVNNSKLQYSTNNHGNSLLSRQRHCGCPPRHDFVTTRSKFYTKTVTSFTKVFFNIKSK